MKKSDLAESFEALAAETLLTRGPPAIKASKGKTRVLRTETGRAVTLGQVLEAVALKAECEIAVQERRPEIVLCRGCKCIINVAPQGGKIPELCLKCKGAYCPGCGALSAQAKPLTDVCGECVRKRSESKATCPGCGGKRSKRTSGMCHACQKNERAAARVPRTCADCPAVIHYHAKSLRCRSCGCRWREANKTPEQKEAQRANAKRQRASWTPEQTKAFALAGVRGTARVRYGHTVPN